MRGLALAGSCAFLLWAANAGAVEWPPLQFTPVYHGVSQPTHITNAGDGSGRLFMVEQRGRIRVARAGALLDRPFLDIAPRVSCCGERGLLSVAFPPGYATKRYFYVNYTDTNGDTTVSRFSTTADPDVADPNSETIVLKIAQPFSNHNGGQLVFGPDGYLYIGMGDGGSAGDPQGNGQKLSALLAKLLRIDVESGRQPYGVPPNNPFTATSGARPEIWAYGLRNPWRFSFDRATGDLYIADVGQDTWEEVDFQPAASRGGENYGWNRTEGNHCFGGTCSFDGITMPVAEYNHSQGCSVTGGFVYRGARFPALQGIYFYGDYCSGRVWGLTREGGQWQNTQLAQTAFNITTFGEDEQGEVYVADAGKGDIHLLTGPTPAAGVARVVNAASGEDGVSPGSIASVFGTGLSGVTGIAAAPAGALPLELAGTRVAVNGEGAPLFAVANVNGREQINFQAPYDLAGASTAEIVVSTGSGALPPVRVPVVAVQPGIFATGGIAAAQHGATYQVVTAGDPAAGGEVVLLYGTGFGTVNDPPATGRPALVTPLAEVANPLTVTIGGQDADVLFAGLSPGLAGVYQVNARVPPGTAPGLADVVITVAGRSSAVAKLPVR